MDGRSKSLVANVPIDFATKDANIPYVIPESRVQLTQMSYSTAKSKFLDSPSNNKAMGRTFRLHQQFGPPTYDPQKNLVLNVLKGSERMEQRFESKFNVHLLADKSNLKHLYPIDEDRSPG